MPSSKKRDTNGRFTTSDEESMTTKIFSSRIIPSLKGWFMILILFFLGLPWSVLFYEPAKIWSGNAMEYFINNAMDFKASVCSCSIKPQVKVETRNNDF
jgi:hypothetical protein